MRRVMVYISSLSVGWKGSRASTGPSCCWPPPHSSSYCPTLTPSHQSRYNHTHTQTHTHKHSRTPIEPNPVSHQPSHSGQGLEITKLNKNDNKRRKGINN